MLSIIGLSFARAARAHRRAWILLVLLTGVTAGGSMAALATAHRTDTAYPRFLEATQAFDLSIPNASFTGPEPLFDAEVVRNFPEVEVAGIARFYPVGRVEIAGRDLKTTILPIIGAPDGTFGERLNRYVVLDGRRAIAADEVVFPFTAASRFGVKVGDTVRVNTIGPRAAAQAMAEGEGAVARLEAELPDETLRVVGIASVANMFPPVREANGLDIPMIASPAYARANTDAAEILMVRLRDGRSDVDTVLQHVDGLTGGQPLFVFAERDVTPVIQRSIGVEVSALRLLAIAVGILGGVIVAQALRRQADRESTDSRTLAALGLTSRQLVALSLPRHVLIGAAGAAVAMAMAIALSAVGPVGVAQKADLDTAVQFNLAVFGLGAVVTIAFVVLAGTVSAWRASLRAVAIASPRARRGSSARLATLGERAGAPPTVAVGTQMALRTGGGPAAVPVRPALAGAALSVASIVALVSFTASLHHLLARPALYGWSWDVQVGGAFGSDRTDAARELADDPAFSAVALGATARVEINGRLVDGLGIEPVAGTMSPTVISGRPPQADDEVILGAHSLDAVDASVGDRVRVGVAGAARKMRVVGVGLIGDVAAAGSGHGAGFTLDALASIAPEAFPNAILLRYAPGIDRQAAFDRLWRDIGENGVYNAVPPADLADIDRVGSVPFTVAGLFAAAATAVVVHMLATSVRRRRHEFAILKTMGFVRRQLLATVAWQATTIAVVGLLVGIPLGIWGGRMAWRVFSDYLGVAYRPVVPWSGLTVVIVGGIALANLVALPSGRAAARVRPGPALRTE